MGPSPQNLFQGKKFDEKKLEKIVSDWILSVRKEAKDDDRIKDNVAKEAGQVLVAALKASFSPSSEQNKKENLYPPHVALHMLIAFAFRIADSAEDFSQLDAVVTLDKKAVPFSAAAYGEGIEAFKAKFVSEDSASVSPKEGFLFVQGYEKYKAIVPDLVSYRITTYKFPVGKQGWGSIEYPDCGETSLLNFFRIVLGKEGAFSPEYVRAFEERLQLSDQEKTQAHDKLLAFFKDNPAFSEAFTGNGHAAWSQVVSNLNAGRKNNPVIYGTPDKSPVCNIKAYGGISNMLSVIEKLIPHSELMEPWDDKEEEKLKQVADKLTALCTLFSRDYFLLDWNCNGKKELIRNSGIHIDFSINGKTAFVWAFGSGHFEIFDRSMKWDDWRNEILFNDDRLGGNIFLQSLFVKASDSTHPDFQPAHLWGALRMINVKAKGVILCRLLEKAHDRPDFLYWATVVLEKNFPVGDGNASGVLWPLWDFYKDLIGRNSDLKEAFDKRLKPKAKPTSQNMLVTSVDLGYTDVVKHILSQPNLAVDFKSQVLDGDTLLHLACKRKNQEVIRTLVQKKEGVDVLNSDGDAPLHIAIDKNDEALINLLLEHEADVNLKNGRGDSPFHIAINKNNNELIKLLLEHQADRKLPNHFGELPIHLAVKAGNEDLVRQLVEEDQSQASLLSGCKVTPLHIAAQAGDETICQVLIDRSADVNAQDHMGRTPLHYGAMKNRTQTLKLLLEKKADVNLKDKEGFSALHHAVKDNNEEAVTVLVEGKADVNIGNKGALRPLHIAVKKKNTNIGKILLDKGVRTSEYFRDGSDQKNALAMAIDNDDEEMVQLIIDSREPPIHSVSCQDRGPGQYPECTDAITYAKARRGKKEILDLLEEYEKTLPKPEDNTEYDDDGNPIF